jgi:hypothetical protein
VVRYAAGQHKAEQNSKLYTAIESALDRVTGSGPGLETVDTAKKVLFNIQRQICSFSTVSLVEVARAILGEDDFMITEKDTNFVSSTACGTKCCRILLSSGSTTTDTKQKEKGYREKPYLCWNEWKLLPC